MTAAKQAPPDDAADVLITISIHEYLNLKAARDEMTAALLEIEVIVRDALVMAES